MQKFPRAIFLALLFSSLLAAKIFRSKFRGDVKFLFDAVTRSTPTLAALKWDANSPLPPAHVHQLADAIASPINFPATGYGRSARTAGAHFSALAENIAEAPSIDECTSDG